MTSATADALRTINADPYDAEDNPGGLDGEGGMAENLPKGFGLMADACDEVADLVNSINFVAQKAAVATILQQVQALVGQVTAGSTNALAFPAVDKSLLAAADVVATYVYDTRQDDLRPDGSHWRNCCQRTSWYSETLNTATRGARREFPMVAGGYARSTAGTLVMHDLLDLDPATGVPRLWKSWSVTGIAGCEREPRHGRLHFWTASALYQIDFAADRVLRWTTAGRAVCINQRVADFSLSTALWSIVDATNGIVSNTVNWVHSWPVPGSQKDTVSGLPVPTVVTATASGVSVIHPNGAVYELGTGYAFTRAFIAPDYRLWVSSTAGIFGVGPIPYADVGVGAGLTKRFDSGYPRHPASEARSGITGDGEIIAATDATGLYGLTLYRPDYGNLSNSMVAYVTKDYATGWMPGDIRGAYLCDGTTGSVTGSGELVTNPDFASGTTGWTAANGATLAAVSGRLQVTNGAAAAGQAQQAISTVVGQTYSISFDVVASTSGTPGILIGTAAGFAQVGIVSGAVGTKAIGQFTATTTTTYLSTQSSSTSGATYELDNISVRLATPDRSYKGKGLQVVGSWTRDLLSSASDTVLYGIANTSSYGYQPYSADYDFGTAGGTFPFLLVQAPNSAIEVLFERAAYSGGSYSGAAWRCWVTVAGNIAFAITDDAWATQDTITSTVTVDDSVARIIEPKINATSGKLEMWIDGVKAATDVTITNATASLTNTSAALYVWRDAAGTYPASNAKLARLRASATITTPEQSRKIARDELAGIQGKMLLGGTSNNVQGLAWDDLRKVLHAPTDDGVSAFDGFNRVSYHDASTLVALTSDNVRSVSASGGTVLYGSAAEAGVTCEAIVGKEAVLDRHRPRPSTSDPLFVVSDNGAVVDVAPRITVGEREHVTVETRFSGRVYGPTDSERLSYVRRVDVYRDAGGNVTMDGTVQTIGTDREQSAAADFTFVVDTTAQTVTERLTGVTGKRIEGNVYRTVTRISEENSYAA